MKQWKLAYELLSRFSAPVSENYYKLRCFPRASGVQSVISMDFAVEGSGWNSLDTDLFGNTYCIGSCMKPHDKFRITMDAIVGRESGPEPESLPDIRLGMYRSNTRLTALGDELLHFYNSIKKVGAYNGDPWQRTGIIMSELGRAFHYESGVTGFDTSAEDAFRLGKGVCQDYAHILLALCRHDGITARYSAGMIPGEGATHAWIDVYSGGFWKGFDPTHLRETDESYIIFSTGTDARLCTLNRGVFKHGVETEQQVKAVMEEA